MSRFWFSPKNIVRYTKNILSLFSAVDADFDDIERTLQDLGERVSQIDGVDEQGRIKYHVIDPITDHKNDLLTDETDDPIFSNHDLVMYLEKDTA